MPKELTPQRWKQIDELLQQALELPADERQAFLDQNCLDDEVLRGEVLSLLRADQQTGALLDQPLPLRSLHDPSVVGRRVGAYKLIRELGRGGMGAVYLGERDDDQQFHQQVAIKLIKRGMDTDEIIERFRHERRILASLNHPNIARLLDGGTTDDGLPYFVMELIEGEPLPDYCRQKNMGVVERLKLFLQVCQAVQHAHNNLIIHRDLKPSNILVTPSVDGKTEMVKLLDFGIAKLLGASEAGLSTLSGQRPMTPEYASPEQVRAASISTATDVYSLGVVLYQLLADALPYQFSSRDVAELSRVVCEQEPLPPSRMASLHGVGFSRKLRGDLDNIVMAALRKEPERRYQSPAQLAEEIERHLAGQPVKARPNTFSYRTGKFLKRNRAAAAAGTFVLTTLVAGIIVATWQARVARAAQVRAESALAHAESQRQRAEREQAIAERQRQRAEEALAIAESHRKRAEDAQAKAEVLRVKTEQALAETSIERARALSEKSRAEAERTKADQRFDDVRKLATTFLFDFHNAIQDLPGSTKARQLVVSKAVEYLDKLARQAGDNPSLQRDLAASYSRLSAIQGTSVTQQAVLGDGVGEMTSLRKAQAILESLTNTHPDDKAARGDLASLHLAMGIKLLDAGDEPSAFEHARKGLEIRQALAAADPENLTVRFSLATAHRQFWFVAANTGSPNLGLDSLRQSVAIAEALVAASPNNAQIKHYAAIALRDLGAQLWYRGELTGAWERYQKSREILESQFASDPGSLSKLRGVFIISQSVGELLMRTGRTTEALEVFQRNLELTQALVKKDPANVQARRDLSIAFQGISAALEGAGQFNEALNQYRKSMVINEELTANDKTNTRYQRDLGTDYHYLAKLLDRTGDTEQALAYAQKAQAIFDEMIARDPKAIHVRRETARNLILLAKLLATANQMDNARRHTIRALEIQKVIADWPETVGLYINEYAWPLLTCEPEDLRSPSLALHYAKLAAEKTQRNDPEILKTLSLAYSLTGNHSLALETARKALSLLPANKQRNPSILRNELESQMAKVEAAVQNQP
jgi:eukaryotic-like serine/threonine-protein kinase